MDTIIRDAKHRPGERLERLHVLLGESTIRRIKQEAAFNYRDVSAHVRLIIDGYYESQDGSGKAA